MKARSLRLPALQYALFVGSLLAGALPAAAQITVTPLGPSELTSAGVFSTFAYDDKHDVYLHVWEFNSTVMARFIGANGAVLGIPFDVGTGRTAFAGAPKVAYSRGNAVDEFFVLFLNDPVQPGRAAAGAQRVQFTGSGATGGQLLGGPIVVSPNGLTPTCPSKPNGVVYNPITSRFFVAYEEHDCGGFDVWVRHFEADGTPTGPPATASFGVGVQGGASLAFDFQRNRYLVSYFGNHPVTEQLSTCAQLFDGNTGQVLGNRFDVRFAFTIELHVAFLPEGDGFVIAWTEVLDQIQRHVVGRFIPSTSTDGTMPNPAYGIMTTAVAQGAATFEYDYVTRLVLVGAMSDPFYIRATVLNASGVVQLPPFVLGTVLPPPPPPTPGSFNPVVKAAEGGIFGVAYTVNYVSGVFERFQVGPIADPPGPCYGCGPPPPPPPPPGHVIVAVDLPGPSAVVPNPFLAVGWSIDTRAAAGAGNGVDSVHVYAIPHSGNPAAQFIGILPVLYHRDDVAQFYGAQFTASGWAANIAHMFPASQQAIATGVYTLVIYGHSTITGQLDYDHAATRQIQVSGGAYTAIESPQWGAGLPNGGVGTTVVGYAVNLSAPTGTGIEGVDIWAFNALTGTPSFLGPATYGLNSAAGWFYFGDRFLPSGYSLTIATPLPPGYYYIVAYSKNAGTGAFNFGRIGFVVVQ
jgi:hypothetical protein